MQLSDFNSFRIISQLLMTLLYVTLLLFFTSYLLTCHLRYALIIKENKSSVVRKFRFYANNKMKSKTSEEDNEIRERCVV